ncbi:hypothetical protein GEV33_000269 [Tenebrio molitor]|uniref:ABC transmembrane type-1 domain-containing protein n=1 Tax=Tenebrio molitor TaxID=7067 RepID=A0A8J6HYF8_TENMO|nr:hypothetical protein GEV33_000269 [Tenebrio molitor]
MEKGNIAMMGSYDELHEKDLAFRALLGDVAIKPDTTDHAKTKPKAISTYNGNILVEKEDTQRKMGSWALYAFYFRLGGLFTMLGTVFTFLLMGVMWSSADFYLAYWVTQEKDYSAQYNHTNVVFRDIRNKTIYTYLGIVVVGTISHVVNIWQLIRLFTSSSTKLHQLCFSNIINATVGFFHKNTPGIILNRFLEDFKMLDQIIPIAFHFLIEITGNTLGVVGLSAIVDFRQLLPVALLFLLAYYSKKCFMKTSKDCKRLECISRLQINHTT